VAFFSTADTKKVNAQQEIDRYTRISGQDNGLAERLNDLDAMGIDVQLVMPPPFQCYYTVPLEISIKACCAKAGPSHSYFDHTAIAVLMVVPVF
jgi:hypothetical protein